MKFSNEMKGITLIALVITIIVLLILAGVSVATLTGDNGIVTQAQNAKEQTEITSEKEQIQLAAIAAIQLDGNNKIDTRKLEEELNNINASIISEEDNLYYIKYNGGKRYYQLNKDGTIELIENVTGEKTLTVQCVNSNNEVLLEKTYKVFNNDYDKKLPDVNGYEPMETNITGNISNDTTIKVLYYKILDDDTELVFTGLNSSGQVTTIENEIVSYMVGDNSKTAGNGFKNIKSVKSILAIPDSYKGKNIIKISENAFRLDNTTTLVGDLIIPNNVQVIGANAFWAQRGITQIIIGKGLTSLGGNAFGYCEGVKKVVYNNETKVLENFHYSSALTSWTEFEVNDDNKVYKVVNNILYSKDGKTLFCVPSAMSGKVVVEEETINIWRWAFMDCKNISEVIFGNNVTTIGQAAFVGTGISELIIPESVSSIGVESFYNCKNLGIVKFNSTIVNNVTNERSLGDLIRYANTIYTNIQVENYISQNYQLTDSDLEGYLYKYIKN